MRYRHTDTDIVRSARQQDFIREAKDQYGQTRLIANRDKLLRIFGKHTQTDPNLHTIDGLINLFNLVAFSDGHAIREVQFPAILEPCAPAVAVLRDRGSRVRGARVQVVHGGDQAGGSRSSARSTGPRQRAKPRHRRLPTAGSRPTSPTARPRRRRCTPRLPVYYPQLIAAGTTYEGPSAPARTRAPT